MSALATLMSRVRRFDGGILCAPSASSPGMKHTRWSIFMLFALPNSAMNASRSGVDSFSSSDAIPSIALSYMARRYGSLRPPCTQPLSRYS